MSEVPLYPLYTGNIGNYWEVRVEISSVVLLHLNPPTPHTRSPGKENGAPSDVEGYPLYEGNSGKGSELPPATARDLN